MNKKSNDKPLVSVIVPVYNTAEYLEDCLFALINQTLDNIEIILVNDKSTDCSLEILTYYANFDDRIILINNEENLGLSGARNTGMKYATGEYIVFYDSDDFIQLDAYEKLYKAAKKSGVDFICFNAVRINDSGNKWASILHSKAIPNKEFYTTNIIESPNLIYDTLAWDKFIKHEFYKKHDLKFKEGILYEDLPFTAKLFQSTDSIGVCSDVYYYWRVRQNQNNISITQRLYNLENLKCRFEISKELVNAYKSEEKYHGVLSELYVKLLQIDIMQFINVLDVASDEFKHLMNTEVKKFVETFPQEFFDRLKDNELIKYNLFLHGDFNNLINFVNNERRQNELVKNKNFQIISKTNK